MYSPKKVKALQCIYFLFLIVPAYLTVISSPEILKFDVIYKLGQIVGIWALGLLVLQFVLSSRIPLLERHVGLDRIMRWHFYNALILSLFVFLHPLFIFLRIILSGNFGLVTIQRFVLGHWLGVAGLVVILGIVVMSMYHRKIKLRYDQWRYIHTFTYAVIPLGFMHSFMIGSDIVSAVPLFYWWIFLLALLIVAITYRCIIRPILFRQYHYKVVEVNPLTHDVNDIKLMPLSSQHKKFEYKAGQFAFVRFYSKSLTKEEHPFTISSSPTEATINFSIKNSGDYTGNVAKLSIGDIATIEAPYGVFSIDDIEGPFVFIAGGIGITPFRSILKKKFDRGELDPVTLIYGNKTLEDIAFLNELETIKNSVSWLKITHVISNAADQNLKPGYYTGTVTADLISKEVPNLNEAKFYICGPPPMMKGVTKTLKEMGVQNNNIYTEKFALR